MQAAGRSPARTNSDAAGYLAVIDIGEPTLVELTVEGPLDHPGSATIATARRWVMPGQDMITADGWVIEVPGIVITPKVAHVGDNLELRSEEQTSELQSLMRISYAVFCLKKKKTQHTKQ